MPRTNFPERGVSHRAISSIGRLDQGLEEAKTRGWTFVDMKRDWNRVYPFEGK